MALDRDDLISGLRADDVDASIHPSESVLQVAAQVAASRGWPSDWLNTAASQFIPIAHTEWEPLLDEDGISVWVASPEMLVAMKLRASRPGRDDDNIAHLLSLCSIGSVDAAEEHFEYWYPGGRRVRPRRNRQAWVECLEGG